MDPVNHSGKNNKWCSSKLPLSYIQVLSMRRERRHKLMHHPGFNTALYQHLCSLINNYKVLTETETSELTRRTSFVSSLAFS